MSGTSLSTSLLITALMVVATPACTSTTWNARFMPTPAETWVGPLSPDGDVDFAVGPPIARMLFSIRGAERRNGDKNEPFEMHVRLRVENQTDAPLDLLLEQFLLLDANLDPFQPARVDATGDSAGVLSIPGGQPLLVDLMFPFPDGLEPGDLQLDGLNLRGALRSGDAIFPMGVTFTRGPRIIYRDPWYGYYPYYGPWIAPAYGYRW
jgi:hypothetical protein